MSDAKFEEITGTVTDLKCQKPTFCAGFISVESRRVSFSVKGYVKSGDYVTLSGRWEESEKWGRQFKASRLSLSMPTTPAGLIKWLEWNGDGIGPVTAQRLVDEFGVELMDRCASDPQAVAIFGKIKLHFVETTAEKWSNDRTRVGALTYFASLGLSQKQCDAVVTRLGDGAVRLVQEDPYSLIGRVDGFGWVVVDGLAKRLDVCGDDPRRLRGAVAALVREAHDEGSTCVNVARACQLAAEKLSVRDPKVVAAVVAQAIELGTVKRFGDGTDEGDYLATSFAYTTEETIWRTLARFAAEANPFGTQDDDKARALAESYRTFGEMRFDDEQMEAIYRAIRYRVSVVCGGAGVGKCLGIGTPVMIHSGKVVPVEDVRPDDLLMGPDSQPRRVVSISRGNGPLYKITPIKGDSWVCNDAHVMTLKGTNKKSGRVIDVPLNDHISSMPTDRLDRDWKLFRVPVDYPDHPVPFDPYLVGVWIGDGTTTQSAIHLGPKKTAVLKYVIKAATDAGLIANVKEDDVSPGLVSVYITSGVGHHGKPNPFRQHILNDCCTSEGEKLIPDCYLFNSRVVRLEMLAALIDTDGSLANGTYDWISKSKTLAEQMIRLCRSLGLSAHMKIKSVKLKTWTVARDYYRVSISGDLSMVPCKAESKKGSPRNQIKDPLVTGWNAEPIGKGDYFGFTLEGDGRFLLGDFTVTHNTQIARQIAKFFRDGDVQVRLCAPTGRAAKRLSEVIGRPAETIHRLLEFNGGNGHFHRDRLDPLTNCAVIADEASMISSELFYRLLVALGPNTCLVLIGDPNQLPPVDAGNPLRDVLVNDLAPATNLTICHRQAGYLKTNCTAILAGNVEPSVTDEEPFPWIVEGFATTPDKVLNVVRDLYAKYLPKWGYDPVRDVQFMTARHDGPYGTKRLNLILQHLHQNKLGNALSPPLADAHDERPNFYAGDKVVIDRNDYDLNVFNGEIGVVVSVAPTADEIFPLTELSEVETKRRGDKPVADFVVNMGDREVTFPVGTGGSLSLAYCLSIHRMQGSQTPCAVVVMPKAHAFMQNRSLFYTSCTRAQKTAVVIGDWDGIRRAAEKQIVDTRVTILRVFATVPVCAPDVTLGEKK